MDENNLHGYSKVMQKSLFCLIQSVYIFRKTFAVNVVVLKSLKSEIYPNCLKYFIGGFFVP